MNDQRTTQLRPVDYAQPKHREAATEHLPRVTGTDENITTLLKDLVELHTNARIIATNFYTITYGDMMQMANELKAIAPGDTMSAETIAAWLYAWAKAKAEAGVKKDLS